MSSNAAVHAEDVTLLRKAPLYGEPPPHVRTLFERLLPLAYANLGNACNLACPYCSVDDHCRQAPDTASVEAGLALLAELGLHKVTLIGGEPTLRRDLPRLIACARGLGITEVNLTTNGLRLADEAFLDRLVAAGLTSVQFSLHAAEPDLIGRLAAEPGAGPTVLAALERVRQRAQLWTLLVTLVTRPNLAHLPRLVEAVAGWQARAGAPLPLLFTGMVPQARGLANAGELLPAPAEAGLAVRTALERARELGVPALHRNLAPCLVPGWEAWSADGCTRDARLRLGDGAVLPGQRDVAWHLRLQCQACRWSSACRGVHAGVVALHGWEAHHPVAPPRPRRRRAPPAATAWLQLARGTAVVVGGSGLLGRHVVRSLLDAGWRVTSVSRRGEPARPGLTVVQADRGDAGAIAPLVAAAPELWIDLALFDAAGANALVDAWRPGQATRFVAAGSVAEYGVLHERPSPLSEDAHLAPVDAYGRGKAEAWGVLAAAAARGMPVTWAVLPQLWGPGDHHYRDGALVHAILAGRPVVLKGGGETLVPDGYAGTAAEALIFLANLPGAAGRRVHVSGPEPLSVLAYVRLAAEVLRRDAAILQPSERDLARAERAVGRRLFSAFPARELLLDCPTLRAAGFRPSVRAADGVRVTALAHAHRPAPATGAADPVADEILAAPNRHIDPAEITAQRRGNVVTPQRGPFMPGKAK